MGGGRRQIANAGHAPCALVRVLIWGVERVCRNLYLEMIGKKKKITSPCTKEAKGEALPSLLCVSPKMAAEDMGRNSKFWFAGESLGLQELEGALTCEGQFGGPMLGDS